ncbi:hypothetical protein E4T52_14871 [Aureobasidium sp. EXF-3400]|nr:hypothetical protein E4T51_07160 [Aureobasidium sp. EXF-12344]KAI4770112.1 hypothetical protein E4T52_14871 [Aureobasidium sp. EXF-3400]
MSGSGSATYYAYKPSLAAAVVFIVLFFLTVILHIYQISRTRSWFWIPFITGGIFEIIGYLGRAINATETRYEWSFGPFVIQTLFILLAPVLFAASMYMMLGRIALVSGSEHKLIIRRSWLTKIFVLGDILAFFVQAVGGVMLTQTSASAASRGQKIVLVGLFIQIIFFGLFITTALVFAMRAFNGSRKAPWRSALIVLIFGSTLIMVRCIYRVVEYIQGKSGHIMSHEAFIYVFDASLMFIVMILSNTMHPSMIGARVKGGVVVRLWAVKEIIETSATSMETLGYHETD